MIVWGFKTLVLLYLGSLCLHVAEGQTPPVFNPFTAPVNIHEDTKIETSLVDVDCTDPTDGHNCLCNVRSSVPANAPFEVFKKNSATVFSVYYLGVSNAQGLDFQSQRTYFLTIRCDDEFGDGFTDRVLEVDVQQNQHPIITNTNYPTDTLPLDTTTPVVPMDELYTVTATDPEDDTLSYSITTTPTVDYFTMGLQDGIISAAVDLRTATEDRILIVASVTDGRNVVNDFEIFVTISNLNTRPVITNLPETLSINEDALSGDLLITLTLEDPDIFVPQLIPVCTVDPDAEQYKFTYETGTRRLRLSTLASGAVPVDYERINLYLITCVVSDGYLDSVDDVLTLNIENINEPPEFDEIAYYCDMDESDIGVSSCDLNAVIIDPESDTITSISFLSGNNSDRFRYDRSTSRVSFNVNYDIDNNNMPTSVVLQLQAVDVHGEASTRPVYINIQDVNDNTCDFNSLATFSIDQGTSLGSLGTLVATDDDTTSPNNVVSFEVTNAIPADSFNFLAVYPDGQISYTRLIPEANHGTSYSLIVQCKDGGSPQRTAEGAVVISFQTTTTTSTTTTTTSTTTTSTTTTTVAPSTDPFDDDSFVALFATFMTLLILGLLVGLYFLMRMCGCCGPIAGAGLAGPGGGGLGGAMCGGAGCGDFCCPKPPPPKVEPVDNYFNPEVRTNNDYRDAYWRNGDNFETGQGYDAKGDKYDMLPNSRGRPALRDPLDRF
ncbi:cadherin-related family member 1 [Aplysia californica]|uniref:Cadherin-related family member 1 n=1 Tax=Aplysia californica TaxID=6500 RepID=A0ABM1A9A0_APLCA|nr:cadherin-related family member 1 [Aplysia californica]